MISIQLWRARIGLLDAKRHSGPRSSFSSGSPAKGSPLHGSSSLVLLHKNSSIPPTAHSPICDLPPGSSTDKHVPSTDHNHEHKCAFSTETGSSSSSVVSISRDMHERSAVYTNSTISAQLGSKTVHSLLSSMTDGLYLPSDLLKDSLVMLLVAIISQLLVLSGDIETNPGPIASDKPTMNQLISLKKTDVSGEYLRVIEWITSLSRSKCHDFAHLLLVDPVKVRIHKKLSNSDKFVRAVLEDWLSRGERSRAVPRTWTALADCMEDAGLPGDLVKAIRETCPSGGSPQVQIEDEDFSMSPAIQSSHSDTSEVGSHGPVEVVVKPNIPKKLPALMKEYADMLVVLQTARLSKETLYRLKLFLSDYCDESSFENCPSPKQIVKQLKVKLKIDTFNIDTLCACCEYFKSQIVNRSVQQYKKHLNKFLSTTSVKELQYSLQTDEITCLDDTEPLTLKLKESAIISNDTFKNLKKLVYHFFGHSSKAFIILKIRPGCVCVTWIVPASLVSTLRAKAQQLSPEYLASRGVLELVIGLRIAPNEDATSKAQVADAAVLQFDRNSSSDSQRIEEQQRMFASILRRKESEFETEKKEKLRLEKEYEKLELKFKEVTNEKFEESNELQKEVKILQEKLAAVYKTPMKVQSESHQTASKVKQLEGPSDDDLPQSSGVQTDELMTASPPSATKSHKPVTVQIVRQMIDIEYQCPICLEVFNDSLTEPYLTDCGHHLCGKCCDQQLLKTSKTECPTCREPDMLNNARCDKFFQRMVKFKNVKVRCAYYMEGCEWIGELKDLNDHLDRQCRIACPFGCGKYAHSSDMKEHTCRHCHNRMISCENCGYYNTFTIVTEKHYPICPRSPTAITPATVSSQYLYNLAPIEFTIGDFSEKKRANEEWHSSPFYTDNRGYKFRLNVHPNGIHDGSGSHLSVHAEPMRREYDFEGDIQIELLNWREDKNHHSAIICFNRYNHTMSHSPRNVTNHWQEIEAATRVGHPHQFISHNDLEPTSDTKYLLGDFFKLRVSVAVYTPPLQLTPSWQHAIMMGPGEREVTPLSSHDDSTQPIIAQFTISEFSKRKQFNNIYFSPPFTTSPHGYKFSIKAFANGFSSGRGSNITMSAIIMKGQHDDHLKWPFTGTIIIEVLNWLEDKRHFKQVLSIDPNDGIVRVTKGEYGKDFGFYKFMSHASLSVNSSTNTQYLSKDCICVRVRKSRAADDML